METLAIDELAERKAMGGRGQTKRPWACCGIRLHIRKKERKEGRRGRREKEREEAVESLCFVFLEKVIFFLSSNNEYWAELRGGLGFFLGGVVESFMEVHFGKIALGILENWLGFPSLLRPGSKDLERTNVLFQPYINSLLCDRQGWTSSDHRFLQISGA